MPCLSKLLPILGIAFIAPIPISAQAQNLPSATPVRIQIDASSQRHSISPLIYCTAFATSDQIKELRLTGNRIGGDNYSRYNWKVNTYNIDADWYFESRPGEFIPQVPKTTNPGAQVDRIFDATQAAGAQTLVTVSMIGWVAKVADLNTVLYSYSVKKYGPQKSVDPWTPDAGNGIRPDGSYITDNDKNDANVPASLNYQKAWIQHLVRTHGTAVKGGVKYYLLDCEPGLWHETHRDVHPAGATSREVLDDIASYARMIKSVDPNALIVAPEEWGYLAIAESGADKQYFAMHPGAAVSPDAESRGGMENMPWILKQLHARDQQAGRRSIDYFTIHLYPQGGEVGDDVSEKTQLLRNRSTRQLWDPAYVDQSWINKPIDLIPRMKGWARDYYPGTKIGVTEYNWGAEKEMNGATAQADILGIFGRDGVDMASRWTTPGAATPVYQSFKLYRNYDNRGGAFGSISVSDTPSSNPDDLSSFAAVRRSDGALTVIIVNKQLHSAAPVSLGVAHFPVHGSAQLWQLAASNKIVRLPDASLSGSGISLTVPAQSVTLVVLSRALPRL